MHSANLDEATFQKLPVDVKAAFLPLEDAVTPIRDTYADKGFRDDPQAPDARRIVRVVSLRAGTRLFKLSQWEEKWERDPLSSWWSPAEAFEESDLSAKQVFETALLNGVTLRDYVRFASAVTLNWNLLGWYIGIVLTADTKAYWGQFTPQAGSAGKKDGTSTQEVESPSGEDTYVHYDASTDPTSESYLPPTLGGVGAWQLYIPDFSKTWIDPKTIVNIASDNSDALAGHLGVTAEQAAALHEASAPVRK